MDVWFCQVTGQHHTDDHTLFWPINLMYFNNIFLKIGIVSQSFKGSLFFMSLLDIDTSTLTSWVCDNMYGCSYLMCSLSGDLETFCTVLINGTLDVESLSSCVSLHLSFLVGSNPARQMCFPSLCYSSLNEVHSFYSFRILSFALLSI